MSVLVDRSRLSTAVTSEELEMFKATAGRPNNGTISLLVFETPVTSPASLISEAAL